MKLENVNFVNLTPHEVVVFAADGSVLKIPPSGQVARVAARETQVGTINGIIPVFRTEYGEVEGLPEPKENTIYIVSLLVLQALRARGIQRNDVVAPNSGPGPNGAVRDEQGRIIGVRSFIVL
jgi:hypothetical protein